MATIKAVKARSIFDSRGNPTVEVDIHLSDGYLSRAAVPSGASTGVYEALELRDGGKDYMGKGVSKAVENVNKIIGPALIGKDPVDQTGIDNFMVHELDGTRNKWGWCKQKLGANAILAVSLAVCKAGAYVKKIPLYQHIADIAGNKTLVMPVPAFNVINGGSHAGNKLAMQEFMILPVGASSFREAMQMGSEVYHHLKAEIKKKYGQDATNVGDEGGFAPNIRENKEGLELLKIAIGKAGYTDKVVIGIDVAASVFYTEKDQKYDLNFKEENNNGSQKISGSELIKLYESFIDDYPIESIENPFHQDDWAHYAQFMATIGDKVQIVEDKARYAQFMATIGGDLLVTNPKRVGKAINEKSCNALLLKNDNGSQKISGSELIKLYESFIEDYPIVSIEDPFDQDDWAHYAQFTATIGDDLLVPKPKRVGKAIHEKSCNALLLKNDNGSQKISGSELIKLYKSFIEDYPIVSIEDPFDQDDWAHYAQFTATIGDDLLVPKPKRVRKAIHEKSCNALLLKVNQIGSVTESIEAVKRSKRAGWGVITSHRSGETEDTFIADLAVGLSTGQIKTGAPCRSERLAKYNQLLRIEEELGSAAVYGGAKFRQPVQPY